VVMSLILSGVWQALPAFWPKDDKERARWTANGWQPGMVIIPVGGGQEIHVSSRVGPFSFLRPGIAMAAAYNDARAKLAAKQRVADERAAKLGIPTEQLELGAGDLLNMAVQTGYSSVLGGRTAAGAIGSFSDYQRLNLKKVAAAEVGAVVPGLPALNEFGRLMGGNVNPKMASFWDLLVPLPTSGAQRTNVLGDPMRDENDFRRVFQIMSGGSFPFPTTPGGDSTAYATLFNSDYRPPSINPGRGYVIGGKLRPMNQQELETYTAARGAEFKRELGSLGANPSEGDVKAAFVRANGRALATVGAGSIPRTRNAARVRVSARSRPAGLLRGGLGRRRRGLRLAGSRLRSSRRRRRLSLA